MHFVDFLRTLLWLSCLRLVGATDNGLTDLVSWDSNSLFVNGNRVFIFSGEFHYPRLPVPEMWRDVFQKFKANGLNAVSLYFFWSYHSASKDVFDFETAGKNVQKVLDYAQEAGLYVLARPGPYINAETSGGGLALWTSDGSGGKLRTSNETYHQAWLPYITKISEILEKNQITNGGPVILDQIENELQETSHVSTNTLVLYMEQIEKATREAGIVVPTSHNEKGMRSQSWSSDYLNVGGAVDIYGLDSYPGGMSCTNPSSGFSVVRTYYQWFESYAWTMPKFLPEFEGGWYSAWGGSFYDTCSSELNPQFIDVYYKNNIGQQITMLNIYMAYGGTNYGHLAAPVVYSSYDYAAPLRETREIRSKFSMVKLIGLFTRVSADLLKTDMVGNGTGYLVSSDDIYTWVLRNPDTQAGFYTLQHATSKSTASTTFSVTVNTTAGNVTIPNVNLNGRQSKIVTSDYSFGNQTLLYCSADILTYGEFDNEVLVLYLDTDQVGEFAFKGASSNLTWTAYGVDVNLTASALTLDSTRNSTIKRFTYTQSSGAAVIKFSNDVLLYLLDRDTAYTFWAPPTTTDPYVTPADQIFVLGPYLVRNVSIADEVVTISGDNANTTDIEVYVGDSSVSKISWNGELIDTTTTAYGSLVGSAAGAENRTISLPSLTSWLVNGSFPEVQPDYDDSNWTVCNHTTTKSPTSPSTLPVLFASDYGFYPGIKIYRGYFDGTNATSINITAQGGIAFGWNAWVNGQLAISVEGDSSTRTSTGTVDLTGFTLKSKNNVVTVLCDYSGHDQTSTGNGVENPRGLLGATITGSSFTEWRIQGNAGGSANIDTVRGPLNEGGLYGERLGWHLPGFDTSSWESGSPLDGFNESTVKFYITTFDLDIDEDLDAPIGLELDASDDTPIRVQIFMNGYQYGKFVPTIGPQTVFPFPPGVINNRGTNTLALSVWAQTDDGASLSKVELVNYGKYYTNFDFNEDWSYLQPEWSEDRLQYA